MKKCEQIFYIMYALVGLYAILSSGLYLHGTIENPIYLQIGSVLVLICSVITIIISFRKIRQRNNKGNNTH